MFDVVLVTAYFNSVKIAEPLGLGYLAAVLRGKGYSVKIVEPTIEGLTIEETVVQLVNTPCKILGISVHRDKNVPSTIEMVKQLRSRNNDLFVCIGGHGPSLGVTNGEPNSLALGKLVDCFILGEGEVSFAQLVDKVLCGQNWYDLPGIAYLEQENVFKINASTEKIKNLDELPFMARDILEAMMEKYNSILPASILFSRGCAYNKCTYCTVVAYESLQKGTCYRQRSVKNIIAEIEFLHQKYGITSFHFEDDNFILPGPEGHRRIKEFCCEVGKLGFPIKFNFFCRADAVEKETFTKLKNAGLNCIYLGIESVNNDALSFFSKGLTIENIERALDILHELGYSTDIENDNRIMIGYILWHPFTSLEELKESKAFIHKYKMPPKLLRRRLRLYTGAKIVQELVSLGLVDAENKTSWRYQIPWMKCLELAVVEFIDTVNKIARDKIRSIEKAAQRFGHAPHIQLEMVEHRKYFDTLCLTFFDGVIKLVEDSKFDSDVELGQLITRYTQVQLAEFTRYLAEQGLERKISEALNLFGLSEKSVDVFRN